MKPPSACEVVHQSIRGSEYRLIRDAEHTVVIEKPQEVFELVRAFLARSE